MRKFKSVGQAQRFFDVHAPVHTLFNLGRHLISAKDCRNFRRDAFTVWQSTVV
jgi:putative transposase